ncbi:MAG: thioredoxin domain-containing protein [Sphingomonadales bacterium]|nr:thioredoxin domain-containing protein [Sphingomonadales bacterium]
MKLLNILKIAAIYSAAIPVIAAPASAFEPASAAAVTTDTPAPANWLGQYAETPLGSFTIGNPDAPVKLVEYASYTCSHCVNFEVEEAQILKEEQVAGGKVNFEIRSLVRDPIDLIMASLARCGGKDRFFANHHFLMLNSQSFTSRANLLSEATIARLQAQDWTGFMVAAYSEMEYGNLVQQIALDDASAKACLADKNVVANLFAVTDAAQPKYNIMGTPSFLINEKLSGAHNYQTLKPLLAVPTPESKGL